MALMLRLFNFSPSDGVLVRRERSKVPLIVRQCVEEIERRGMEEVGIYRVSGVATDIQALKAAFDSSEFNRLVRLSFMLKTTRRKLSVASCRQQRRVHADEGDGRECHRRNTEAVFP